MFLGAGVLFVGHAVVRGIEAFTTMPPPVDMFGPTGFVVAILGLLGLYPSLSDVEPRISHAAAILAAVTIPAWSFISAWNFGEAAGMLPPQTAFVPGVFYIAVLASTLLIYSLFGLAGLRSDIHTRTISALLVMPVLVIFLLLMGGLILSGNAAVGGVLIGGGQALAHGAIGATLLTGHAKADHVDLVVNVTVE